MRTRRGGRKIRIARTNPSLFPSFPLLSGLAVYNRVLLDFPLPLVLYKKLLGLPVLLRDLEDMQPTIGRSLRTLLQVGGCACVCVCVHMSLYACLHSLPSATPSSHPPFRLSLPSTTPQWEGPPGSVENTFCLSFSYEVDRFGYREEVDLLPGGRDIAVTEQNRME